MDTTLLPEPIPPPTIRPRPRQRKAARAVVKNALSAHPKTLGEVMEDSGYGSGAQNTPAVVTESPGFKAALREMGLTEELVTNALVDDINGKKLQRVQELKLAAEILGMVKREPEKPQNETNTTYNFIFSAETQADVKAIEDKIKARLTQPHVIQTN